MNIMKTLKYITGVLAIAAAVACGRKEDYVTEAYATFTSTSFTVNENVGTVDVPVTLHNSKGGDVSLAVAIVDGTAVAGTNCEIVSPASGVLTFAEGETEKNVTVSIKDQSGVYTGKLTFRLSLTSVTDGVSAGAFDVASFTINDLDHPLADILGSYTASGYKYYQGVVAFNPYTLTLSADDDDVNVVWVDFIVPMLSDLAAYGEGYVKGTVSSDHKTISFTSGDALQAIDGEVFDLGYGTMCFYGCSYQEGYRVARAGSAVNFVRDEEADGIVFKSEAYGVGIMDDYVWPSYGGFLLGPANDVDLVWTKQ